MFTNQVRILNKLNTRSYESTSCAVDGCHRRADGNLNRKGWARHPQDNRWICKRHARCLSGQDVLFGGGTQVGIDELTALIGATPTRVPAKQLRLDIRLRKGTLEPSEHHSLACVSENCAVTLYLANYTIQDAKNHLYSWHVISDLKAKDWRMVGTDLWACALCNGNEVQFADGVVSAATVAQLTNTDIEVIKAAARTRRAAYLTESD